VSPHAPPSSDQEEFWRDFLSGGHSKERAGRRLFKLIPHDPRCRLCAAPFSGVGAPLMRLIGKRPSDKNPNWCSETSWSRCSFRCSAERGTPLAASTLRVSSSKPRAIPISAGPGFRLAPGFTRISGLERRPLELKGKQELVQVVRLTVSPLSNAG
jgi:hypothetical protein